jgi:hypothetical protein
MMVALQGMLPARAGRLLAVSMLMALLAGPLTAGTAPPLTLQEAEKRLVQGGYLDTLYAAQWAAAHGEAVIPILAQMLEKVRHYREEEGDAVGAFPFNVLWALAHIPGSKSRQVLETYYDATEDPTAALALAGWRLRYNEQSTRFGVLARDGDLLERPEEKALVVKKIKAGQKAKILQEMIANTREVGPRGGARYYDRVELLPSGEQGYIPRAGDDFSPFM